MAGVRSLNTRSATHSCSWCSRATHHTITRHSQSDCSETTHNLFTSLIHWCTHSRRLPRLSERLRQSRATPTAPAAVCTTNCTRSRRSLHTARPASFHCRLQNLLKCAMQQGAAHGCSSRSRAGPQRPAAPGVGLRPQLPTRRVACRAAAPTKVRVSWKLPRVLCRWCIAADASRVTASGSLAVAVC